MTPGRRRLAPAADGLGARARSDPAAFLRWFLEGVGAPVPPGELTPALLQGARTLIVERYPWEAEIPLDTLAATPFPKLVVSGAHIQPFEASADVLEALLDAERAVLPGVGHSVQRLGAPFNDVLADFVTRLGRRRLHAGEAFQPRG